MSEIYSWTIKKHTGKARKHHIYVVFTMNIAEIFPKLYSILA